MQTRLVILHFAFYILHLTYQASAQNPPKVNVAQLKARYPNDEMAYLNRIERVTIEMGMDGKPQIDVLHQEDRVFLADRASIFADDRIYFSETFQEISEIKAASLVPEKTGFKRLEITDFKTEKPSPGGGIFYDDMMVKKFTYPAAKPGGIGTLTYRERVKNPYMLSGFVLAGHVPMLNTEFSVTFPTTVKVSYKTYGDMKGVQFKQSTLNGKTTYQWKAQNLKAYPIENDSPSLRFYAPQVFLFMENYTANGQTVEVLGDVSKLFNYYKSLVKNLNKTPDSHLKSITDSLTRGKSDVDKIKAVYYWVQDHIKYIAFEEGMAGFVPRQAADVYRKRYGDCKDMASLVSTMLRQADVPAHLVWIGTRDIPYRYDENPSMSVDNHMIAAVKVNNEWQFLDATDDRIDFGLPTTHIQGKEAMVMTSEDSYEIVKVPIVPATQNSRYDSIIVSWKDKNLVGKGFLRFDGHAKGYVKSVLQYKSEPQRDEYLRQSLLSRGSNKCLLESKKISNLEARDQPLGFEYNFTVPDYVQQVNQEAFVNPHLIRTWANNRIEQTRQNDWKYNHEFTETSVVIIPLSATDEVTYLPKNVSFNHPKFGFDFKYEQKNKQVTVHTNYRLNTLLVKKEDFAEWNKMVLALNEAYGEVISIKKTTN